MKVRSYPLKEFTFPHLTEDMLVRTFEEVRADREFYENCISFTSLTFHPDMRLVYCGITAYNCDILHTFDPKTKKFRSMNYAKVGEKFDVKIHRSLALDDDGTFWAATACLHDVDQRSEAPGGKILHIFPDTGRIEIVSIPCPPDYIQTICLDRHRRLIYGFTYPVFRFFKYDIEKNKTTDFGYIGSIPHIMDVDDEGSVWGTYSPYFHRLFRYNPRRDRLDFFKLSLPWFRENPAAMFPGAGPIDSMVNGHDGYLYIGTVQGSLVRLDPKGPEVKYLGKPSVENRLPALQLGEDGLFYGACGFEGRTNLFTYDPKKNLFNDLGRICDPERNDSCFIVHDLTIADDGAIYCAETDNPKRSGYLWECKLS